VAVQKTVQFQDCPASTRQYASHPSDENRQEYALALLLRLEVACAKILIWLYRQLPATKLAVRQRQPDKPLLQTGNAQPDPARHNRDRSDLRHFCLQLRVKFSLPLVHAILRP